MVNWRNIAFTLKTPRSALTRFQTPKNIQPIRRSIRCQKIRNCILRASRTAKEFYWPFGDAYFPNVTILARNHQQLQSRCL